MPQIRPISELRKTNEISELCNNTQEPIFITKNGYGDLVIMSMKTYERDLAIADVYKKLAVAEQQIASGEVLDGDEVFRKLRGKYEKSV